MTSVPSDQHERAYFTSLLLVLNPRAGTGFFAHFIPEIEAYLRACHPDLDIEVVHSTGPGEITKLIQQRLDRCRDQQEEHDLLVAVAGGDGSLHQAIQALSGRQAALMAIPVGSGNDFARHIYSALHFGHRLGSKRAFRAALERFGFLPKSTTRKTMVGEERQANRKPQHTALQGVLTRQEVDLIAMTSASAWWTFDPREKRRTACQAYALNALSLGWDSLVAMRANRFARRFFSLGRFNYILAAVPELFGSMRYAFCWRHKGEETWQNEVYTLGLLGNAPYYGGGFQPNPQASIADGRLELTLSQSLSPWRMLRHVIGLRQATPQTQQIFRRNALQTEIEIQATKEQRQTLCCTLDGEGLVAEQLSLQICPKALRLALPYDLPNLDQI